MKRAGACIVVALLAGCSYAGSVTRESVEYNGTLEQATNELILENILRARDRVPLYFASISDLKGSIQTTTGTSLPIPFGPGHIVTGKKYTDTLTFSVQNAPNWDIAPLDAQAFMEGILTPIDLKVAQYYWDRNDYPKWLLANLFISKIAIERPYGTDTPLDLMRKPDPAHPLQELALPTEQPKYQVYDNFPDDPAKLQSFKRFLYEWVKPEVQDEAAQAYFHSYTKLQAVGPPFVLASGDFQKVAGFDGKTLQLRKVACDPANSSTCYQMFNPTQAIIICPPRQSALDIPNVSISSNTVPQSKQGKNAPQPAQPPAFQSQSANACKLGEIVSDDSVGTGTTTRTGTKIIDIDTYYLATDEAKKAAKAAELAAQSYRAQGDAAASASAKAASTNQPSDVAAATAANAALADALGELIQRRVAADAVALAGANKALANASDEATKKAIGNVILIIKARQAADEARNRGTTVDSNSNAMTASGVAFVANPPKITIYQRSVEGIISYLGAVIRYNEAASTSRECPDGHSVSGGNPVGFYLNPNGGTFSVTYRDQDYFVSPFFGNSPTACGNYPHDDRGDYSTKVMTLVNELIDLQKNASELPTTQTVITVP